MFLLLSSPVSQHSHFLISLLFTLLLFVFVIITTSASSLSPTTTMSSNQHFTYEPNQYVQLHEEQRKALENTPLPPLPRPIEELNRGDFSKIKVAAVQLETPVSSPQGFVERAENAVIEAVYEHGANLVLLQELFQGPYFCQSQEAVFFATAESDVEQEGRNAFIVRMQYLAKTLQVVLPISLFERYNNAYYNSVVMIDADGSILGTYRKTHIPDGTGYQEKYYFTPGDTGFKVFHTKVGVVGVGICWDQWFPETARAMALLGADVLLYPTAIGSEPQDPTIDSADHWQRAMQGHAASNVVPVIASNRYGTEILLDGQGNEKQRIKFYGRSFITDEKGAIIKEAKDGNDIISAEIDIFANRRIRHAWGLFRDRRPEMYGILRTKDGNQPM
jgi:N-carbamoylputrescine amidase